MKEIFGDKAHGKDPLTHNEKGIHIDLVQSVFDCPICTCENDIADKIEKAKLPVFKFKCKGCKRKLQAYSCPLTGELTIHELLKK